MAGLSGCSPRADVAGQARAAQPSAASLEQAARQRLDARLQALGRGFDGSVGIAVREVGTGWTAAHNGRAMLPQQSVSKLWVAVAVLDAVDREHMRLGDPVRVGREDLSVFHQPIREKIGPNGYLTTIGELLAAALVESDNAANEVLTTKVGGPEGVRDMLARKRLADIAFGPGEKTLQSRIAGLSWRPQYSHGRAFWAAREALPAQARRAAMDAYLADPADGASATAMVEALARLHRGDLLSRAGTDWLLATMATSKTGPKRLRGGLPPGWTIAHKTGTGQVLGPQATGYNDVGLITAPDGRAYAVAVMIASTRRPVPERQALMGEVVGAVVAHHDGRDPWAPVSP